MYPLNDYQSQCLRRAMIVKHKEMLEYISYGLYTAQEAADHLLVESLELWPCDVPGLVRALSKSGHCVCVLYPCPRPVNCDPLFFKADPVDKAHSRLLMKTKVCSSYLQDWQIGHGPDMDAPDEMPAGSTYAFESSDDSGSFDYGVSACQSVWRREE